MTLRNRFLDAIIDGEIGNGVTISRQEFMDFFSAENPAATGCFLSNSEIVTGAPHSPNYTTSPCVSQREGIASIPAQYKIVWPNTVSSNYSIQPTPSARLI